MRTLPAAAFFASAAALFSPCAGTLALPPAGSPPSPSPAASDPLAGPSVGDRAAGLPSLVRKDFDGKLVRLEAPPAELALDQLDLPADVRARIDQALAERAAILDKVVRENIGLLMRLGAAGDSGRPGEAIRLLGELLAKLQPLSQRGSFEDEAARLMPQPQQDRYKAIIREYYDAVALDGVWDKGRVSPGPRTGAIAAENLRLLGRQAERSFQRQFGQGEQDFERLLADLNLRPEQEQRVRELVRSTYERTLLNPSEGDKLRLFMSIMAWLDLDQQQRLVRIIRDSKAEKTDKPGPAKPASGLAATKPKPE